MDSRQEAMYFAQCVIRFHILFNAQCEVAFVKYSQVISCERSAAKTKQSVQVTDEKPHQRQRSLNLFERLPPAV